MTADPAVGRVNPFDRLSQIISKYVADYELVDTDKGDYFPTNEERILIEDAIHGIVCNELFSEVFLEGRAITHASRLEENSCIRCGAPNEYEHYHDCITRNPT